MKFVYAVLLAVLGAIVLMRSNNSYNLWTGDIVCSERHTCLHEAGHARDRSLFWVSRTAAFAKTVTVFNSVEWLLDPDDRHDWAERMHNFPGVTAPKIPCFNPLSLSFWQGGWGGYTELYAEMWAWADGDIYSMPNEFQKFYEVKR